MHSMLRHGVAGALSALSMILASPLLLWSGSANAQQTPVPVPVGNNALFKSRVLTTGLANPWAMRWGPDGKIWVTERSAGRVTRVDPQNGKKETLLKLTDVSYHVQHEGLFGMVLHPELMNGTGNDYVYLVYTYELGTKEAPNPRLRLVRFTYDKEALQLVSPLVLVEGVPAWTDHAGGRVAFGPDNHLYWSLGDQGRNYSGNYHRPNRAQQLPTQAEVDAKDWTAYSGKILRVNLDGSIPEDNPSIKGVKSHIFSYGHRNPQGLSFGRDGMLYETEHGPDTDDELNIITAGGNYGWPNILGFRDDKAYIYANWSKAPEDLRYVRGADIPKSVPQFPETTFPEKTIDPLATYWTVGNDFDFSCGWTCRPTIGPGSVLYYAAGKSGIKEWDNTALIPTLKHGVLYIQRLSTDGKKAKGLPEAWFSTQNRYRDIIVSPNNDVFIATDGFAAVVDKSGDGNATEVLHNPGAILLFTYNGAKGKANGAQASGLSMAAPQAPAKAGKSVVNSPAPAAKQVDAAPMDFDSVMAKGRAIFGRDCAACHGAAGQGAQGPKFVGNERALGDRAYLARTIVQGGSYMPSFAGRLDDAQVAAVATYIRNSWGNKFGPVAPSDAAMAKGH